jgi:hypothetical protein
MILSSWRRSCFQNFPSAKDFPRTRYSVHTTRYFPGLGLMQTMIADMREYCSRLGACGVKGHYTRSSKKSCREWELRSNLITTMVRSSTAGSRTRNTALRPRQQTIHRHRTRTRIRVDVEGAIPKVRLGILEMISRRALVNGATLSHRLPRSVTRRAPAPTFCGKLHHTNSKFHSEQTISKTRKKMGRSTMLEPG